MSEVILPCPYCKGTDLGVWDFVVCKNCEMRGPRDEDESAAIAAWNNLPRALTWTHEPPRVVGKFWIRDKRHPDEASIINVTETKLGVYRRNPIGEYEQFAGPISPPID